MSNRNFFLIVASGALLYLIIFVFKNYWPIFYLDATLVFILFIIFSAAAFSRRLWRVYKSPNYDGNIFSTLTKRFKHHYTVTRPLIRGTAFLIVFGLALLFGGNVLEGEPNTGKKWIFQYIEKRKELKNRLSPKSTEPCPVGYFDRSIDCICPEGYDVYAYPGLYDEENNFQVYCREKDYR